MISKYPHSKIMKITNSGKWDQNDGCICMEKAKFDLRSILAHLRANSNFTHYDGFDISNLGACSAERMTESKT